MTTARVRELTHADAAVVELRERDAMVYRAVAGTAKGMLGTKLDVFKSLSGRSVLEARTLVCLDSEDDPRVDRAASRRVGARSMLCAPLLHEGTAVGALKVYASEPRFFDDDDVTLLELMVGFIAAATANAVTQRAREASERRFRAVAELASDGIITSDASGMIVFLNTSAARMFGYDEQTLLQQPFTRLLPERYPIAQALAPGQFDPERARALTGQILELSGKRADASEFPLELSASMWSTTDTSEDANTYFTAILRDVTERKELEASVLKLARTDHLTGLLTRRAGQEQIERETVRCQRYGQALSFLLFDLDHFKQINDTAGHPGGDQVLHRIGALVIERVRSSDVAIRWGGEEFLLMLPHTPLAGAALLAEALRSRVEHARFEVVERVTISAGAATLLPGEYDSAPAIARADAKLYEAKRSGRNRVLH